MEFYIGQGRPNLNIPLSFDLSDESSIEEPVVWINGMDFTFDEVVKLRNGEIVLENLGNLLNS